MSEAMRLKYYPTFDGDGTTAQNKKYSYEFSTSMWNSPSSYRDESVHTIKAAGWRSSNGAAADFNGQLNPTVNEVTVRALIAGQATISVNAIFAFSHAVKTNGFKQRTDLLGNLSTKTAISNATPNVSVRYGLNTSPVTVQDNGTVNLGVGEILQFNYSISPLHTDYATQLTAHWDSDKKTVATLDSDTSRKLTAIDTGLSNVTASIGGVTFKFTANVSEPKLSLSYQGKLASPVDATSPRTVELTAGESMDLTMGYAPRHDYTSLNSVTWNSSDTNVATVNRTSSVSSAGNTPKTMVTAKLPGTVTITGTLAGRQVKTTIKVVDATLSIVRDSHQDTPSREDDVQVPVTGKNVDATSGVLGGYADVFSFQTQPGTKSGTKAAALSHSQAQMADAGRSGAGRGGDLRRRQLSCRRQCVDCNAAAAHLLCAARPEGLLHLVRCSLGRRQHAENS